MFKRQTTGSIVCPACGRLVGINDSTCFNCGRPNPGMWGYALLFRRLGYDLSFVNVVIWGCSGLYLATLITTLLVDSDNIGVGGPFSLLSPGPKSLFLFGESGAVPMFVFGRWWTVLSAAWLHGGLLHILFNMMWVRQLAPATGIEYGMGRMVIIYTVSSIVGFLASSCAGAFLGFLPGPLSGASFTVGASAPIFGLLGALVYSGKRGSSAMGRQAMTFAVILFVFGLVMPRIDNWAHLGGFAGGYLMSKKLDPLQPERTDHLIIALICVGLTVLSVLLSIVHGLKFL